MYTLWIKKKLPILHHISGSSHTICCVDYLLPCCVFLSPLLKVKWCKCMGLFLDFISHSFGSCIWLELLGNIFWITEVDVLVLLILVKFVFACSRSILVSCDYKDCFFFCKNTYENLERITLTIYVLLTRLITSQMTHEKIL